jgi:hypothetical protein
MSDPEWAAIRRAYRNTMYVHRRMAVAVGVLDLTLIITGIWLLIDGDIIACSLVLAAAFGGVWFLAWVVGTVREMAERLEKIDGF